MADNISLPAEAGSPELLAANEVDLRGDAVDVKVPLGGIIDAREGGVSPLAVETSGRLIDGTAIAAFQVAASGVGVGGYSSGDVIGDPVWVGRLRSGLAQTAGMFLADTGGNAVKFDVVLIGTASTGPHTAAVPIASAPSDGDNAITALTTKLLHATILDGEAAQLRKASLSLGARYVADGQAIVITDSVNGLDEAHWVDVWAVFVANATISAGATAPLVAGVLRRFPTTDLGFDVSTS